VFLVNYGLLWYRFYINREYIVAFVYIYFVLTVIVWLMTLRYLYVRLIELLLPSVRESMGMSSVQSRDRPKSESSRSFTDERSVSSGARGSGDGTHRSPTLRRVQLNEKLGRFRSLLIRLALLASAVCIILLVDSIFLLLGDLDLEYDDEHSPKECPEDEAPCAYEYHWSGIMQLLLQISALSILLHRSWGPSELPCCDSTRAHELEPQNKGPQSQSV